MLYPFDYSQPAPSALCYPFNYMIEKIKLVFSKSSIKTVSIDGITYVKSKYLLIMSSFLRYFCCISIPMFMLICSTYEPLKKYYLATPVFGILTNLILIYVLIPNKFWMKLPIFKNE